MSRRGAVLFLSLCVLWGLPYFMIRVAVRQLDPGELVFARTALAALVLVPIATVRKEWGGLKGLWGWLALYSLVELAVPWLVMSAAEQHLTSSLTGLSVATVPLVAIVLSRRLHPDETITRRRLLGLGVGTAGVLTLVGLDLHGGVWWVLSLAIVIFGYATGPMILSLKLRSAPNVAVVAGSLAIVALAYLPWGVTHLPAHVRPETLWSVLGLAVVCTVGAFLVFFARIKEIGPSRSVVVTYLNTFIAVAVGVVGLHEPLTVGIMIGFPLIVAGSLLATSHAPQRN
jgi:drug/metabolite transporter (DMT)-like permease